MNSREKKWFFVGCLLGSLSFCICAVIFLPLILSLLSGSPSATQFAFEPLMEPNYESLIYMFVRPRDRWEAFDQLVEAKFPDVFLDSIITPEEFEPLMDRVNEALYDSSLNPEGLQELKDNYRQVKSDGRLTEQESLGIPDGIFDLYAAAVPADAT